MHQQYSQSVAETIQQDQIHDSWTVQDIEGNLENSQSPSMLNIQRPSRFYIKNKSHSSTKSKTQLIKVSKCPVTSHKEENQKNSQTKSVTKILKKQCRICLEDQAEGRIVKPCKCTGSMQYVHEHCLCEWIKRKINFKTRAKVHCQVCEQPFDYKISKRLSISCEVLKQNYQKYRTTYLCFFIVMVILILIWFSLAVLTMIGFGNSTQNWVRNSLMQAEQTRIIFVCVVLVYLLIIFFVSLLFIAEYGVKTELIIKSVQNMAKRPKKIVPKLYFIAT